MARAGFIITFSACFLLLSLSAKAEGADTARFRVCLEKFIEFEYNDTLKALEFLNEATAIAGNKNDFRMLGIANRYHGWYHQDQSRHFEALESFLLSMKYYAILLDKQGIADSYGNIGNVYETLGDFTTAIAYQHKSLLYNEQILMTEKDSTLLYPAIKGKAYALGNIGNLYEAINDHQKALQYILRSFELEKKYRLSASLDASYTNLGIIYRELKMYEKALECHRESYKIRIERNEINNLGSSYQNIASVLTDMRLLDSALFYSNKAINADETTGNIFSLSHSLSNKARILIEMENYSEAVVCARRSVQICEANNIVNRSLYAHDLLYTAYSKMGNYKEALSHYERVNFINDSLKRSEVNEGMIRKTMLYEFNAQKLSDSLEREKQNELVKIQHDNEITKQRTYVYGAIGGFALMMIIAFMLFKGYRNKQRSNVVLEEKNKIIHHQKELVEEKNKEITDSINYAKRLQDAILPGMEEIKKSFPGSFILYMPKDIVAGDFYFFEVTENVAGEPENIFIAAADCTGHGVPGAMVSVVCSNALKRAVKEFRLTDPGKILDKVTDLVIDTFDKSGTVKDGMDISLCVLDTKHKKLRWSGANNPLWIVEAIPIAIGSHEEEGKKRRYDLMAHGSLPFALKEYKPDKQPIGRYENRKPFTTHEIEIEKNDMVYIFSDGYADQFGGDPSGSKGGKKFKQKRFRELILSVAYLPVDEQENSIRKSILDWKGDFEQNDDITVIGIRV